MLKVFIINKLFLILALLLPVSLQAAQVISQGCIDEIVRQDPPRFTFNPTEKRLYAWERHIIRTTGYANNYAETHYCLLYYIIPNPLMNTEAFPISTATSNSLIHWESNFKSRTSFMTNGYNSISQVWIGVRNDQRNHLCLTSKFR